MGGVSQFQCDGRWWGGGGVSHVGQIVVDYKLCYNCVLILI